MEQAQVQGHVNGVAKKGGYVNEHGRRDLPPAGRAQRERFHRLRRDESRRSAALIREFVRLRAGDVSGGECEALCHAWAMPYDSPFYMAARAALGLPTRKPMTRLGPSQLRRRQRELMMDFHHLISATPDDMLPRQVESLEGHEQARLLQRRAIENAIPLFTPVWRTNAPHRAPAAPQLPLTPPPPAPAPEPAVAAAPTKPLAQVSDADLAAEIERRRAALREQLKLLGG